MAPKDATLRANLARFYMTQGQKDKAEKVLADAKAQLSDQPVAYRKLADFYMADGEVDKATSEWASLYNEHPKDVATGRSYAQILVVENKLDEASKINDAILKQNPKDYEAQVIRGEILNRQSKFQEAVNLLALSVKDAPDSGLAHYQLGVSYAGLANLGQAEYEWRAAGRLQPNAIEPQRALANLAVRKGDVSLLQDSGNALIRIEPNSAEGYLYRARALYSTGKTADAEADIKKAIEVAPSSSAGYLLLAEFRLKQNKADEAEKLFEQALTKSPSDMGALEGLVNLYLGRKDTPRALQTVQGQIAKIPPSSGAYSLLGQLELRSQDSAKAEAALKKAVEIDKANAAAFMLLANLQVSRGAPQEALATYKQGLNALIPGPSSFTWALAQCSKAKTNGKKRRRITKRLWIFSRIIPSQRTTLPIRCLPTAAIRTSRSLWRRPLEKDCRTFPIPRTRWDGLTISKEFIPPRSIFFRRRSRAIPRTRITTITWEWPTTSRTNGLWRKNNYKMPFRSILISAMRMTRRSFWASCARKVESRRGASARLCSFAIEPLKAEKIQLPRATANLIEASNGSPL